MTVNDQWKNILSEYLKEKKGMSDNNISYFISEYEQLTEQEKSEVIYEAVGKEVYKTNPVGIETFIHDPYFLGDIWGTDIFKIWEDLLKEVYPAPFCKKYDQVVLSCATRCFGKGTKILMYDGSTKNVEDIVVGDQVMGDDGTPRNVLSLARGREMMYKVSPESSASHFHSFRCNKSHYLPIYKNFKEHIEVTVSDYMLNRDKIKDEDGFVYLKSVEGEEEYLEYFGVFEDKVDDFYGFELDGNHLFRLWDGLIQRNSGKTVVISITMLYELYLLCCMINPTRLFQVPNIVFAILSKDNSTALSQVCSYMYKGLLQSPYFKDVVNPKLSFSKADKEGVTLIENVILRAGSSLSTVIGTNLYAGCVDEANAPSPRIAAENLVEVRMKIYQEMRDRREASFSKAAKMTGMLMFTSSPTDEGDVLSEIINNVKEQNIPYVLIRDDISRWEAREEDMDETFDFFLGSDTKDPCILDGTIELTPTEWERVIQVPAKADYYSQFSSDPYLAIQNIAGRRTMPETSLFNTVAVFEKVFKKEQDIFITDTPCVSLENGLSLDSFLRDPEYFSHPNKPECFRYIHLDMAYRSDRFGLCSAYSDRVKFVSEEDGQEIYRRKYYIDFCLGVTAKNRETIDILKVLEFVYSLKERGYPLKLVTTDNHQGEIARQMLKKKGVKTDYLSMEKSKEQYLNMKNIIITESLEGYRNPALIKELRGLRESQKKIEKGKGYTDDMSDALAGALWSCSQDKFYKRNNEAISEIIKLTGDNIANSRNFTGITNRLSNRGNPFKNNGLGFHYGP